MPSLNTKNAILSNAITVDSSYNVAIGGTPTAIGGYTSLIINNNSTGTFLDLNNSGINNLRLLSLSLVDQRIQAQGTLRFDTAGIARMAITSDGNVGIGTTAPETNSQLTLYGSSFSQLHMQNGTTGTGSNGFRILMDGNNLTMTNREAGYFSFETSDVERMRITSGGNVGIGTSSPTDRLSVTGIDYNNVAYFLGGATTGASYGLQIRAGSNSTDYSMLVQNQAGTLTYFKVNGNGNVGIGTSSPNVSGQGSAQRVLTVQGTAGTWGGVEVGSTGNTSAASLNGFYGFTNASLSAGYKLVAYIGSWLDSGGATSGADMRFFTQANGVGLDERMRITSGGGVVIGATTTGYKFEVNGGGSYTALFNQTGGNASFPAVTIQHNATSGTIYLEQFYAGATNVGSITTNGTITSYNVSSDYRLKEDFKEFNGLNKVLAIKTYDYKWKNSEDRMDGVIAHELAEVLPYAVINEKDGVKEDGTIIPQGVDYSKIVPILVKAIQEQQAQIEAQQQQINSLINR